MPKSRVISLYTLNRASLVAQLAKTLPAVRETGFKPWVGKIPWRRERLPTPIFWPGEFHGLYSPRDCKESDTTERLSHGYYLLLDASFAGAGKVAQLSSSCLSLGRLYAPAPVVDSLCLLFSAGSRAQGSSQILLQCWQDHLRCE